MDMPSVIVIVIVGFIVIFTLGFLILQFIDRFDFSAVTADDAALFEDSTDHACGIGYDEQFMVVNINHEPDPDIALNISSTFDDSSFSSLDSFSTFDD